MRKSIYLLLLALLAIATGAKADVQINSTNFPDPNFRSYLLEQDYGKDGVITDAELSSLTTITVSNMDIKSLQGIENFNRLMILVCNSNLLSSLDLSKNTQLTTVYCSDNSLSSLDISKCTQLYELNCFRNKMNCLDVTNNTKLKHLICGTNNLLNTLDVSSCIELEELLCGSCNLNELDISNNVALKNLICNHNRLTSLDLSKNTKLEILCCDGNKLSALDFSHCPKIRSIDIRLNRIKGDAMDALIASLPKNTENYWPSIHIIQEDKAEENVCTKAQVKFLLAFKWNPHIIKGNDIEDYEGSAPLPFGDLNGDGNVNSADIQKIYGIMAEQ